MNKETTQTSTTSEKKKGKSIVLAVAFLIVCFIFGILIGVFSAELSYWISEKNIFEAIEQKAAVAAYYGIPFVMLAITAIVYIVGIAKHHKAKKIFSLCDAEDDIGIEKAEKQLTGALVTSNIGFLSMMVLLPTWLHCVFVLNDFSCFWVLIAIVALSYIASMIGVSVVQWLIVELAKKMNPEKKGDVLSAKFEKDWENSLDEREKTEVYRAGFKAYKAASKLCLILWMLTLIGNIFFGTGLFPILIVCIFWFVLVIAYQSAAAKK